MVVSLYLLLLHTNSAFFLVLLSELAFLLDNLLSFSRSKKRAWASTRWRPRVTGMEEIQETSGDVGGGMESHSHYNISYPPPVGPTITQEMIQTN